MFIIFIVYYDNLILKTMKSLLKPVILVLVIVPFLFSNCASIVTKTTYPMSISSDPQGADIKITDKKGKEIFVGKTPATIDLKAGAGFFSSASYVVDFTLDGYDPIKMPIQYKLEGWYFGNILFGGIIGMLIVDPATGAMWAPKTQNILATFTEKSSAETSPKLEIIDINDIPDEMKNQLVRVN